MWCAHLTAATASGLPARGERSSRSACFPAAAVRSSLGSSHHALLLTLLCTERPPHLDFEEIHIRESAQVDTQCGRFNVRRIRDAICTYACAT